MRISEEEKQQNRKRLLQIVVGGIAFIFLLQMIFRSPSPEPDADDSDEIASKNFGITSEGELAEIPNPALIETSPKPMISTIQNTMSPPNPLIPSENNTAKPQSPQQANNPPAPTVAPAENVNQQQAPSAPKVLTVKDVFPWTKTPPKNEGGALWKSFDTKRLFDPFKERGPVNGVARVIPKEDIKIAEKRVKEFADATGIVVRKTQLLMGMQADIDKRGFLYNFDFAYKNKDNKWSLNVLRTRVFRPTLPLDIKERDLEQDRIDVEHILGRPFVHMILPLSGRVERFTMFVQQLISICQKSRKHGLASNFFLTVVYFDQATDNNVDARESVAEVEAVLLALSKKPKSMRYFKWNLIRAEGAFNRGRGLEIGVLSSQDIPFLQKKSKNKDILMLFIDVDIEFGPAFMERCRRNSFPGKRLYFPVVWSTYNPEFVRLYAQPKKDINVYQGFWRTFGFGMACMYKSDFMEVGGFNKEIQGWGGEDVDLFNRLSAQKHLEVIRAPDPDIFHMYHPKFCAPDLSKAQTVQCIHSRAMTEGNQYMIATKLFNTEKEMERKDAIIASLKAQLTQRVISAVDFTLPSPAQSRFMADEQHHDDNNFAARPDQLGMPIGLNANSINMLGQSNLNSGRVPSAHSLLTSEGRPNIRVFVYDLPAYFNAEQLRINRETPPPIRDPDCTTNFYSVEVTFHQWLLKSEYRTVNPEEADFFYVPTYSVCYLINNHPNNLTKTGIFHEMALDYITHAFPFWNRTNGRDHIWTFSQGFGAQLFGDFQKIHSSIMLVHNGQFTLPEFTPMKDISIAPDLSGYGFTPVYLLPGYSEGSKRRDKQYLAHFGGTVLSLDTVDHRGAFYSRGVRQYIKDHFFDHPDFVITGTRVDSYVEDMMSATFCLAPEGWHAWNPRPYYAILLGCIPVLLSDQLELAFEESIDYDKFMIRINVWDVANLETILRGISPEEIARRQDEMEKIWRYFYYGKGGVAAHAIMAHLALRKPPSRIRRTYLTGNPDNWYFPVNPAAKNKDDVKHKQQSRRTMPVRLNAKQKKDEADRAARTRSELAAEQVAKQQIRQNIIQQQSRNEFSYLRRQQFNGNYRREKQEEDQDDNGWSAPTDIAFADLMKTDDAAERSPQTNYN